MGERICIGDDVNDFANILSDCLLPQLCKDSTPLTVIGSLSHQLPMNARLSRLCGDDMIFDVIVFVDNSCALFHDDCMDLLDNIGNIIDYFLNYPFVRVGVILFGATKKRIEILVDFEDVRLQNNAHEYVKYIQQNGKCEDGGNGDTNLYAAIKKAHKMVNSERVSKFIIVSQCMDDFKVCKIAKQVKSEGIDVHIVNLYDAVDGVVNVIENEHDANHYLSCLSEDICVAHGVEEFGNVIDQCLLPQMCRQESVDYRSQIGTIGDYVAMKSKGFK